MTDERSEPSALGAMFAGLTHVASAARSELSRLPTRAVVLVLDSISVTEILEHIDLNAIVSKVDLNAIVSQVDINAIVARFDIEGFMEQVDIEQILDQIDLNAIIAKVDLDALVAKTDVGAIIAQSTGGVASDAVDLVRRQAVGVDEFVGALAGRLRLKRNPKAPSGPPLLLGGEGA